MPGSNQSIQTNARRLAVSLAGVVCLATACATAPMAPTESLNDAQRAIEYAEKAGASRHAPADLDGARQRLERAENAVKAENMEMARRFADESAVTAKRAAARAELAKAAEINEELNRSAEALVEEMQRTGEQQ